MACICLGEAPRVPQRQEILLTLNLTDENLILMPSFSDDLFDTKITPGQTNQASPPSPIPVSNAQRYMPPTSPTYSTDSQATLYLQTSISINLEPQSSSLFISLPILPGDILMVITDPQQCQLQTGPQFCQFPTILSNIHVAISAPPLTTSLRPEIWKLFSGS